MAADGHPVSVVVRDIVLDLGDVDGVGDLVVGEVDVGGLAGGEAEVAVAVSEVVVVGAGPAVAGC